MKIAAALIEKYHHGLCTGPEKQAVEQWLADAYDTNVPGFPQHINKLNVEKRVWDNINRKTGKGQAAQLLRYSFGVAASLFIISLAVWLVNSNKNHQEKIAPHTPFLSPAEKSQTGKGVIRTTRWPRAAKINYKKA